jgi:hypothetical protein
MDLNFVLAVLEDYVELQTSGIVPAANRYAVSDVAEQIDALQSMVDEFAKVQTENARLNSSLERLVAENTALTRTTTKLFGALQSAVSQGSGSWPLWLQDKAQKALDDAPKADCAVAAKLPLTDEQISLGAHNIDEGDWNSIHYQKVWHQGFVEGARFAEEEHGIKAN